MRFAYADPPYPRQAKRWYGSHPDYAGEVDHAELVGRLCEAYPDGWALSTSAVSLQAVLAVCPAGVRVAAWNNTNSSPPGNLGDWWWSWEPVIICGGRRGGRGGPPVRNVLSCGTGAAGRFPGGKPEAFCRWMFGLLGAQVGDELDDLFPGSGAVGLAWERYRDQPWIEPAGDRPDRRPLAARAGTPPLFDLEAS